jgi:hypothetical protein
MKNTEYHVILSGVFDFEFVYDSKSKEKAIRMAKASLKNLPTIKTRVMQERIWWKTNGVKP